MIELLEDEWIRDVSTMLATWVAGTLIACVVLLTYGSLTV